MNSVIRNTVVRVLATRMIGNWQAICPVVCNLANPADRNRLGIEAQLGPLADLVHRSDAPAPTSATRWTGTAV